jgi:ADP-heptose:LPS heptosyltransferase
LKVGIHWQGSRAWTTDPRSIELAQFEPLARVEGVTLISLQKNHDFKQLEEFAGRFTVVDFGDELDASGAFLDTAAIMKLVDLVITCDTGLVHVAGALAVNTWVALPRASEWRWMWDREDTPWYPTVRLFRQPRPLDWATPFQKMAEELGRLAGKRS